MNKLKSEIKIIEANKEIHDMLLNFLLINYPTLGWSKEFMQWQYYENPAGIAKSWVAVHKGNIIANYTAIPHQFKIFNNITNSWRVQDVVTHPEYRGLGLYSSLSDAANNFLQSEKFPLNFTFPNENSHNGFIKRNWKCPNRIPLWICNDPIGAEQITNTVKVEEIKEFQKQDEDVWRKYCNNSKIGIDRNVAYLNWRYLQNPKKGYSAFRFEYTDKTAISILKIYRNEKGERYAHLMDYFYDSDFPFEEIVKHFVEFGIEHKVKLSSTWSQPEAELSSCLKDYGYSLQTELTRWLVLNFNSREHNYNNISEISNWHTTMGDTDVF